MQRYLYSLVAERITEKTVYDTFNPTEFSISFVAAQIFPLDNESKTLTMKPGTCNTQ